MRLETPRQLTSLRLFQPPRASPCQPRRAAAQPERPIAPEQASLWATTPAEEAHVAMIKTEAAAAEAEVSASSMDEVGAEELVRIKKRKRKPRDGSYKATLLVECPDRKGVIASLAQLLYGLGCNIVESDQFTDLETSTYFQRIRFDYSELVVGTANTGVLEKAVAELGARHEMRFQTFWDSHTKRVALLVSRLDHCLWDLLIRHQAGELNCEIPLIISNHSDLEGIARSFDMPFLHLPIQGGEGADRAAAKQAQETQIEEALREHNVDVVVLARYMQVLSPEFCARHPNILNIHHSFLPAFEGAKPYHRAKERGVKIIGATAHFVTQELDAGPIIEQEVTRISHKDTVETMVRKGRDLERMVLARALRWVLDDRVLVHGNRTIVFE